VSIDAGDVFLDVRPNLTSFNRELTARMSASKGQLAGVSNALGLSMGQAIGGGLAVAAAVGIKTVIDAASDLGEAVNANREVFGAAAGEVEAFGETAASAFGIAEADALQASVSFGQMFQAAGIANTTAADLSTTMVGLAGDLASFRNEDPSAMLDRLRSGLAGETEPLRRFGIFLSEAAVQAKAAELGIADLGDELTDAQKIQARYAIILEQSEKAQGDFARTLGESFPNQLRALKAEFTNLAAELGEALLPAVTFLTKAFRGLVDIVDFLSPAIEVLFAIVSRLVSPLATLIDLIGKLDLGGFGEVLLAGEGAIDPFTAAMDRLNAELEVFRANAPSGIEIAREFLAGFFSGAPSEETLDALQDLQREADETHRHFKRFAGMSRQVTAEFAAEAAAAFNEAAGSLDDFAREAGLSTQEAIRGMREMAREAKKMGRDLRALDREAVPEQLQRFLIEQGPAAVRAFVRGTENEKGKFERAWRAYRDATEGNVDAMADITGPGGTTVGRELYLGFIQGISSGIPAVRAAAARMANEAVDAANAALLTGSPSRVFAEIGENVVAGFVRGMDREFGEIREAADELVSLLESAVEEGMDRVHLTTAREIAAAIADSQRRFDKVLEQTERHFDRLRNRVGEFQDALRSGFADTGDLIDLLMRAQADALRDGGTFGEAEIGAILADQVAQAQQFAQGLTQLQALGLGQAALADLAEQGPDALPLIQALLGGGEDLIAGFNDAAETIADLADTTVDAATEAAFGEALDRAAAKLGRLEERLEETIERLKERVDSLLDGIRSEAVAERIDGLLEGLRRLERQLAGVDAPNAGGGGGGGGGNGGAPPDVPGWGPGPLVVVQAGTVVDPRELAALVDESLFRRLNRNGRLTFTNRQAGE
jgi:hypothetical protein